MICSRTEIFCEKVNKEFVWYSSAVLKTIFFKIWEEVLSKASTISLLNEYDIGTIPNLGNSDVQVLNYSKVKCSYGGHKFKPSR